MAMLLTKIRVLTTSTSITSPKTLFVHFFSNNRAGDKIPADLRFIWCNAATVDNSSLTGESAPLKRTATARTDSSREAENMGFFGTTLVQGSALGVVIRTGDRWGDLRTGAR